MLQKIAFSISILFLSLMGQSQNAIYSYTFETDMESWKSQSLINSGYWTWTSNGKADLGVYWNDRPPIDGTTNGALVYDGDYMVNSNQGDTSMTYTTVVESPRMDFFNHSQVFIQFNQYFRNYDSNTALEVSSDLGVTWNTININTGVNRNVETSPNDYEIIDISQYAANESAVNVRFWIDGQYYFWILDDIYFYNEYPVIPTTPEYIGEYLTEHGYPYEVDATGWPYIPDEAIVNFAPGTPQSVKDELRENVGAVIKETCVCNSLETWTFIDDLLEGPIGLSSTGPATGANEQVSTSSSASEIDDIDFNKYVKGDLTVGPYTQPDIQQILAAHKPPKGKGVIKIGIIDTGVDILHKRLDNLLYLSNEIPENEIDDDENCYIDNYVGWNFVDDNNNASDDHGHGSHVAGIIAKNTIPYNKKGKVQIIPYKTHDYKGLANLFDVTCAMYQSVMDKVSVVNCSWGFFGKESEVLNAAILKAYKNNILVVAATGNDSLYLVNSPQYPACTKLPNVISVGSYNIDERDGSIINSHFSNFAAKYVDVLATGVNILSTVPYNNYEYKTGTSMAAPAVAGLAAKKYVLGYSDPLVVKNIILEEAQDHDHLTFEVKDGNVLLDNSTETETDEVAQSGFSGKPDNGISSLRERKGFNEMNVAISQEDQHIILRFSEDYLKAAIQIFNIQGQVVRSHEMKNLKGGSIEYIDINNLTSGLYILKINEKVHEFTVY